MFRTTDAFERVKNQAWQYGLLGVVFCCVYFVIVISLQYDRALSVKELLYFAYQSITEPITKSDINNTLVEQMIRQLGMSLFIYTPFTLLIARHVLFRNGLFDLKQLFSRKMLISILLTAATYVAISSIGELSLINIVYYRTIEGVSFTEFVITFITALFLLPLLFSFLPGLIMEQKFITDQFFSCYLSKIYNLVIGIGVVFAFSLAFAFAFIAFHALYSLLIDFINKDVSTAIAELLDVFIAAPVIILGLMSVGVVHGLFVNIMLSK